MPNEWELDREWAEDQATEDYRLHLLKRRADLLRRLEAAAGLSGSRDESLYVAGQLAALKTILKETTHEDSEREQEGAG